MAIRSIQRWLAEVGAAVAVLVVALALTVSPADAGVDDPPPPPVTVTDFYPESANLTDCVGLVERPGCGSESRGGIGQTLTFLALAAGLGLIFWRVSVGVRKNRTPQDA
jgi:hypothetical protein